MITPKSCYLDQSLNLFKIEAFEIYHFWKDHLHARFPSLKRSQYKTSHNETDEYHSIETIKSLMIVEFIILFFLSIILNNIFDRF